jgi:thiamine-monophosphate kinase
MIDISDGLGQDLGHVAVASGVLIDLDSARLEPDPALRAAAAALGGPDPLDWMLSGGEDHALAATFPAGTALPERWVTIGQVGEGSGVRLDSRPSGRLSGWNHFR